TASSASTSTTSSASKASSSYNFIEQMIQRQAQAIQQSKNTAAVSITA
ncbi:MAG: EF-hand domain-containing protein, partial [Tardiphaga sp.]|nr:EF-hand domain-containing protein [Tardiphaga sp.]